MFLIIKYPRSVKIVIIVPIMMVFLC